MWTTTSLDTLRSVLGTLGIHGDSIAWDAARIASLAIANSSAVGRMAAIQAGNSIALEGIGRMQRLEAIAMAQSNAYAVIEANKINEQAQRDAFTRQWLINGESIVPAYSSKGTTRIPGVSR
jgi:P-type conjugative transfer protein TrbJ